MAEELRIRGYEPGDESGILEGWNAIFPEADGQSERDLRYWSWAYERNNLGRVESHVALIDGRIVGQYASIPQRAFEGDRSCTVGLVVDCYIEKAYRRLGSGPGLIVDLAEGLHSSYCGSHATHVEEGHVLTHGYTTRLYRIAQRYLRSEMVRDLDLLFRELSAPGFQALARPEGLRIEVRDSVPVGMDALWHGVRKELSFGLVRDSAYLAWRYQDHPLHDYAFFCARDGKTDALRGVAVYRIADYAAPGSATICDWIVPGEDLEAEDALLAALEERGQQDSSSVLLAEFPQNDPRFLRWQRKGFLVGPPQQFLVMNSFKHNVLKLRDIWYHTLGDSDLV